MALPRLIPAIGLLLTSLSCPAWALTPADITDLHEADTLRWTDASGDKALTITQISIIKAGPDQILIASGDAGTLILDPYGPGTVSVVLKRTNHKDLGASKKEIYAIDDAGSGSLTLNGTTYLYQSDDSDDGSLITRDGTAEISFYTFTSQQDDDDTILFVEKEEGKFDAYLASEFPLDQVSVTKR